MTYSSEIPKKKYKTHSLFRNASFWVLLGTGDVLFAIGDSLEDPVWNPHASVDGRLVEDSMTLTLNSMFLPTRLCSKGFLCKVRDPRQGAWGLGHLSVMAAAER